MAGFGKKKSPKEENHVNPDNSSNAGKFIGFVLLRENSWDKDKFFAEMKSEWGIEIEDDHPEDSDVVYVAAEGFRIIIGLMPTAIPNGEAEYFAKANYMWKDAEKVVARHGAHLLVTVMGDGDMMKRARLYVKVTASLLNQDTALALYSEGAVYQPEMFRDCAGMMKDNSMDKVLPILNLVWFGIYGDGKLSGVYTYGMRRFGKEEIEVYVPAAAADLNSIRNFLVSVAAYVIGEDVVLRDGETIGFSAEEKLPIKVSPGIAVDGSTVKIDITKQN
ncbi:MAG: DUF4261 domain-containing protein [Oscillospiraceae bacterium]|nr:DUF4261 domain-containing protein [Oscillospiraceae bacterium]